MSVFIQYFFLTKIFKKPNIVVAFTANVVKRGASQSAVMVQHKLRNLLEMKPAICTVNKPHQWFWHAPSWRTTDLRVYSNAQIVNNPKSKRIQWEKSQPVSSPAVYYIFPLLKNTFRKNIILKEKWRSSMAFCLNSKSIEKKVIF